jgi:hypothetical protein
MPTRFLTITVVLTLAGATLAASVCDKRSRQTDDAVMPVSAAADATPEGQSVKVYEGGGSVNGRDT